MAIRPAPGAHGAITLQPVTGKTESARRILYLTSAIVLVDTLFFSALTPLLPHYADTLGLGKGDAGLLAALYPLGTLGGAIPSGMVAARFGVKPTVLVGLIGVAVTTALFGLAT